MPPWPTRPAAPRDTCSQSLPSPLVAAHISTIMPAVTQGHRSSALRSWRSHVCPLMYVLSFSLRRDHILKKGKLKPRALSSCLPRGPGFRMRFVRPSVQWLGSTTTVAAVVIANICKALRKSLNMPGRETSPNTCQRERLSYPLRLLPDH